MKSYTPPNNQSSEMPDLSSNERHVEKKKKNPINPLSKTKHKNWQAIHGFRKSSESVYPLQN